MPYVVELTQDARQQFLRLSAREQRLVREALANQLRHQPGEVTRNRKPLRLNPYATWELRLGDLRVLYDIEEVTTTVVVVLLGHKRGNRLVVDGEEITLS